MSIAVPLISITSTGDPETPSYEAQLVDSTVQTLSAAFQSTPVSYPLFVSGNYGKNSLLATVLKHALPDLDTEECFECKGEAPDGVYVWPQPVQLGSISLMLLKMRKPANAEDETYMDLRRKVRAGLMALSSICCLCEDRSEVWASFEGFTRDYHPLKEKLGLQISKVSVFMEESWCKTLKEKTALEKRRKTHGALLDVQNIKLGGEFEASLESFITSLANADFHWSYHQSHGHMFGETPFISQFLYWTHLFLKMSNLNLDFDAFIKKLPDTRDPAIDNEIAELEKVSAHNATLLQDAQAQDFLIETMHDRELVKSLDPQAIECIKQTYQLEEPTVVLMLMGAPGLGKSTLLNYIVQYYTESSKLPVIFEVGNSLDHTTKGSQVLSHPLRYKGHQIMLMDLEGLGGTETTDGNMALLQKNLASAFLTVASVPCLLVSNSVQSLLFVEKTTTEIVQLGSNFGFCTERIHLLFHDRELREGVMSPNEDFDKLVSRLNWQYFKGQEVIKMLNKPNFVAEGISAQRKLFLQTLLEDSLYYKKNVLNNPVNILDLLTKMSLIATNPYADLSSLILSQSEVRDFDDFVMRKKEELRRILSEIKSPDNHHLADTFSQVLREQFDVATEAQISALDSNMQVHCRHRLQLEVNVIKAELLKIEAFHSFIRAIPDEKMSETIKNTVSGFQKASWCLFGFIPKVTELREKLEKVQTHFPESREKVETLLTALDKERDNCVQKFRKKYIISKGVEAVIKVVERIGSSVFSGNETSATPQSDLLEGGEVADEEGSGGVCACMAFTKKADELIRFTAMWGNREINGKVLRSLESIPETMSLPVLLLIGSKKTLVADFANAFARQLAPFTSTEFSAFHPNKYTQVLSFDYSHPHNDRTRGYLICLRMKKSKSKYYHKMLKIAEILTSVTSVTCILVDYPDYYAQPLLQSLSYFAIPDQAMSAKKAKLWLVHRADADIETMIQELEGCGANYKAKLMEEFTSPRINATMQEIKRDFDTAKMSTTEAFRNKISSIRNI